MTLLFIFLLGAGHGLQPDHAAAAAGLAARMGVPAWSAALRIALGHCAALLIFAAVLMVFPSFHAPRLERFADFVAAGSLIVLGSVLLRRVWRPEAETQTHQHGHGHPTPLAIGLGWLLGLSGARSAALLLPAITGPSGAAAGLVSYSAGLSAGVAFASGGVDLIRLLTAGRLSARWLDGALGVGTVASGCWLLFNGARV